MLSNRKFPRILPQGKIAWIIVILFFMFLGYYFFFEYSHPPTFGPFYKEYSTINELYKNAALGDRVKVTINVIDKTQFSDGGLKLSPSDTVGVYFLIPPGRQNQIKFLLGRNIVYGRITRHTENGLICEIEEIKL